MSGTRFRLTVVAMSGVLGAFAGCEHSSATGSSHRSNTMTIHGAGSTFAAPLYQQWAQEFHELHPDVTLEYDSVGSGEGQKRFLANVVDFGASDAALTDDQIEHVQRGAQLIPVAAGTIVLAYNLPGAPNGLHLPRDVYVDIFLGKITSWNDARICAANPQVSLPSKPITVIVRTDSSGTTFAFTNHLAAISKEWRDGPGVGKAVQWPCRYIGATGNEGVAGQIVRIPGAIGYSEFGIAERASLSVACLENKEGAFVMPTAGSGLATLLSADLPANLRAFFPDPREKVVSDCDLYRAAALQAVRRSSQG